MLITTIKELINTQKAPKEAVSLSVIDGSKDAVNKNGRKLIEKAMGQYRPLLVSWLTKKLGDRDSAEDIVQQVFVRALNYADTVEIDNPKALLFKIAANLAMNEFRRRSQEAAHFVQMDETQTLESFMSIKDTHMSPEQHAEDRQKLDHVRRILLAMPERQRKAFLLNRFEGKTYDEIADLLGVSVSTIEKDFMKALQLLRQIDMPQSDVVVSILNSRRRQKTKRK